MKKFRVLSIVICLVIMATAFLGGCKKGSSNTSAGNTEADKKAEKAVKVEKKALTPGSVVIAVGDEAVEYREFMTYMYMLKDRYQDSIDDNIWSYNFEDGRSFEYMAKEETVSLITELKVISKEAKDFGIELGDDEKEDIKKYAQTVFDEMPSEETSEYGIDADLIAKIYMENELANKVYDACMSGIDTNIDENTVKQITVQYLYKNAANVTDSDMQKLKKAAGRSDDFKSFAESNTEADNTELTFGYGDMSEEFTNAAFALTPGQLSEIIAADGGYYIIYCVSNYNEEATNRKKEQIIAAEQKKIFEEKYSDWASGYEVEISNLIL